MKEYALSGLLCASALLSAVTIAGTATAPTPLHPDCPAWLRDYINWHAANKHAPDAKYLMYNCDNKDCQGLADRMRGILWMLRMAVYARRVLLIRMTTPVPLELLLQPSHINWTVPNRGPVNATALTLDVPEVLPHFGHDLDQDAGMANFGTRNDRWLGADTNQIEDFRLPAEPSMPTFSRAASCAMQALYQPTEAVEEVVAKQLAEMKVTPAQPYIAIHLRMWQLVGENEGTQHNLDAEERILTSILCSRDMAAKCGVDLSVNPAVLVTDGIHVRRRVALRLYNKLTAASITPHHFSSTQNNGLLERHLETIADMVILSRARGLFYDQNSGFSRMASYLGGKTAEDQSCLEENHKCARFRKDLDYRQRVAPGLRHRDAKSHGQPLEP